MNVPFRIPRTRDAAPKRSLALALGPMAGRAGITRNMPLPEEIRPEARSARPNEQPLEDAMRLVEHSADWRTSTPLTVIGGAPGAGKTTMIRHFLESSTQCRIVAVVRDVEPLLAGRRPPA